METTSEIASQPKNILSEASNAFNCLNQFQLWYQRQWNCNPEDILNIEKLKIETKDIMGDLKNKFPNVSDNSK